MSAYILDTVGGYHYVLFDSNGKLYRVPVGSKHFTHLGEQGSTNNSFIGWLHTSTFGDSSIADRIT